MSQENVALIRRANVLANSRDWDSLLALFAPDIEWRDQMHAPDVPEVLHGIAELQRLIVQWDAAYATLTAEVLEYIDADPWILCITRWHGEGIGSGTPVEVRSVDAYCVQEGKIARSFGGYPDLAAARKAIGQEA